MNNDIVIFKNGELELEVSVSEDRNTVWLSLDQMAELFSRDKSTISRHIRNLFNEGELDKNSVVAKFATTASDGKTYQVDYFNLDVIISVGYRVKSKRGVQFRIWATSILKNYMLKGYAINQKRLEALDRTVKIQSRIIASTLELDEKEVLNVVEAYADALTMLDDYDHGCLVKQMEKIQYIAYLMKNAETLLTACDLNQTCLELKENQENLKAYWQLFTRMFSVQKYIKALKKRQPTCFIS